LVSVIIKGNTLLISIKEKISAGDYDKPEELTNLVAKHSGLITNINLISGTLKVKVGQIVKVGDVLVEPYIIDSSGEKRTVKADAEIVARVWYRGQEVHSSTRLETKRTGKTFRHTKMTFLGINLSKPLQQPPFESFESKTTSVCISKNTILPIIRQFTIFYETENVQVNQSFEDVKQEVFEKAKQKALQMLDEYEIISKEYFTTSESFGLTTVEYVIETEKLIN
jgi:sporulation protein YqfD